MEIEPEFWEWMREGTPEEKIEKNTKLIKFVRENRRMFAITDEQLDNLERKAEAYCREHNEVFQLEFKLRALEYEQAEAYRNLDQVLLTEENLPTIPLFGKLKKDSH